MKYHLKEIDKRWSLLISAVEITKKPYEKMKILKLQIILNTRGNSKCIKNLNVKNK